MTDEAMSPLRRRMIEDMSMRRLAPKTQKDYIQVIKNSAYLLGDRRAPRKCLRAIGLSTIPIPMQYGSG
jgi:hypothetical protein